MGRAQVGMLSPVGSGQSQTVPSQEVTSVEVSASRSTGTWYQNSSPTTKNVIITLEVSEDIGSTNSLKQGEIDFLLDDGRGKSAEFYDRHTFDEIKLFTDGSGTSVFHRFTLRYPVPPYHYYRVRANVNDFASSSVNDWIDSELGYPGSRQ